jgi:hypothetical protein
MTIQENKANETTTTNVFINLPGPGRPISSMTGQEQLHGFLCEIYRIPDPDFRLLIRIIGLKWGVRYR